jgi:hypothetical protein
LQESKLGSAFGSYAHDVSYKHEAYAPAIIFDTLQNLHEMQPFELGPFNLNEAIVETVEGMRTCQDYGRVFGERLGS